MLWLLLLKVAKFVRQYVTPTMVFNADSGQLLNREQFPNLPETISISASTASIDASGNVRMTGVVVHASISVERDTVVSDLLGALQKILTSEPSILKLPLRYVLAASTISVVTVILV